MRTSPIALIAFLAAACSQPAPIEVPSDGGALDAASDAGVDAASDAAVPDAYVPLDSSVPDASAMDASVDASVDSGPACECTSGPCCDGCHVLPSTTICSDVYVSSMCSKLAGSATVAWTTTSRQYCDGVTSGCTSAPVTVSTPDYCDMQAGEVCRTLTGRAKCM